VVWWQGAGWPIPEGILDLAYTARASTYRGGREVQIEWVDARQIAEPLQELSDQKAPVEVVDHRGEAHPMPILERLLAQGVQVWCEAEARQRLGGSHRYELTPSQALAVWTAPPGPDELRLAVETVAPQVVYLFGIAPGASGVEAFLQRLAGLVKYALSASQGRVSLRALAAATAQREATVRLGLAWLQQRGHIRQTGGQGDEVVFVAAISPVDHGPQDERLGEIAAQLKTALDETTAYRAYFLRAGKDRLF
jgi:hypothetical protein